MLVEVHGEQGTRWHHNWPMQSNEKCYCCFISQHQASLVFVAHHEEVLKKLGGLTTYKTIKHALKQLVYESTSTIDFELGWEQFISNFDLQHNEWLSTLYEERSRWVPCYLRCQFWAGMSTTQKWGYECLLWWFHKFNHNIETNFRPIWQCVTVEAEKEIEVDFASSNTTLPCATQSFIERQFQEEYTHAKLAEVQQELRSKINCNIKSCECDEIYSKYMFKEECIRNGQSDDKMNEVVFDKVTQQIRCICLLFEFIGILCRHSFLVLAQEVVKSVSSKYFLKRWCKHIRRWTLI